MQYLPVVLVLLPIVMYYWPVTVTVKYIEVAQTPVKKPVGITQEQVDSVRTQLKKENEGSLNYDEIMENLNSVFHDIANEEENHG